MDYHASEIRNVAFIGHGGDGKTSLTEALLFFNGLVDRMGKVDEGTTVTDFDTEEVKRHISVSSALAPIEINGIKLNIIDCPGYFDFVGEVVSALRVADGAVIVMNAASGLDVGTEKSMSMVKKYSLPCMIFVGQMDREHTSFEKTLSQLEAKYGSIIVPIMLPITENGIITGYVDLPANKAYAFDGKNEKEIPVPASMQSEIASRREIIAETAAGNDEELMDKFIMGEELSSEEIHRGLVIGVSDGSAVPVMCGSAFELKGIKYLQDMLCTLIPSAAGKEYEGEDGKRVCDDSQPFSAYVYKTITDPFVGKLSIFRVLSGKLSGDTALFNANVEKAEKVGTIYTMRGKKQTGVNTLFAGDIGALSRLQFTMTGHTLCDEQRRIVFEETEQPKPSFSMAVFPKNQGDEDKVFGGLRRLQEEDPTILLEKNDETNEMMLSGIGELQLEVIGKKLKNKFNAEMALASPTIPYRETIRKSVKAQGKHKKQSGGHGQYGDCWVEFSPFDGTFEFVDSVVGGAVPRNFIPAVEKGLRECITKGVLAGYPMVGLRCTLYDGSYHPVDSSEMAFKVAASLAYKKGCREAGPVLLEPIYHVEVTVPDDYMGDIIGDLNKRRGRIIGMTPVAEGQRVEGEVPLAEMFKYATDLRSMTQARGSFEMRFERYEQIPENIAAKVIASSSKLDGESEE